MIWSRFSPNIVMARFMRAIQFEGTKLGRPDEPGDDIFFS